MPKRLKNIRHWVFDLDNTLYSHQCDLFAQVDIKMGEFIAEKLSIPHDQAKMIQKDFFLKYGTTLYGLQKQYDVNPEEYMAFTHDIDYTVIPPNGDLRTQLEALAGRKYIFTNGPKHHAENTLRRLGVEDAFESIFDIAAADYQPKPQPPTYDAMLDYFQINEPAQAVMLDDLAKNLIPASKLGMKTVLVEGEKDYSRQGFDDNHIDFETDHLVDFLGQVLENE